nr:hypothetical protein GCM10020092_102250 [Actinoplanes digitatis]
MTKSFGAVAAVQGVSFTLYAGEAHAMVGENGAGKSTIVKMLAGVYRPDTGTLAVGGAPADFGGPADAKAAGIAVIYQEPTLFPDLSVAENISMGNQPLTRLRQIDRRAMHANATRLFARLGVHIDPDRPARGLSIADQQLVEIAKALSSEARILIMDEPTAALSAVEVERLFSVTRALRDEGAAIMFISHRFEEITALCQRVTIMRDGSARLHRARRRPQRRRHDPPDGRPRPERALPQAGRRHRRDRARGRGPRPRGRLPRHQLHGPGRRDRRPGRAGRRGPLRGHAGGVRRRPVRHRLGPLPRPSRCGPARPGRPWRPAWRWCPRTAASRG